MPHDALRWIAAAALTLTAGAGLAQTAVQHGQMAMPGPATPATRAYEAAMATMHHDMAIRFTGNPDRDFAAGMIPHHQGAIDMAKAELQYGTDPELRRLAQDIVKAQETEITFMRAWLSRQH